MRAIAVRERVVRPGLWSFTAFALAVAGVVLSVSVALGDPGGVRWWLVVAPVGISMLPLLAPRNATRVAAAILLTGWCVVAAASVGLFLWPALLAQIGAAVTERS